MFATRKSLIAVVCAASQLATAETAPAADFEDRAGTQWTPFIQWSLQDATVSGNPFDVIATATFTHGASGEKRTTGMFFDGNGAFRFRFTATRPGLWSFTTSCQDPDLNGHRGRVTIQARDDALGFVTSSDNKWSRQTGRDGRLQAFSPQYVMYGHPGTYHASPNQIDADIRTFIHGHGFSGFHVPIQCRWFDIKQDRSTAIRSDDPRPDRRTFAALELLITKVHAAGGVVHLWAWGDEQRRQTPTKWGINGPADKRLQRYIAARLGPLPGWTMGYGFDLDEWVDADQLRAWRDYLHSQLGWPHLLGGRPADPNRGLDHSTAIAWNRHMDYASYEHHRPSYSVYVAARKAVPGKPVFSEDRFRIRQSPRYRDKDYTEVMTRRGLWQSTLAGGVANIWGKLDGDLTINMGQGASKPYQHPHWIKTWKQFFNSRFKLDSEPAAGLSNGLCLQRRSAKHFIFYREDAESIQLDLSQASSPLPAIAVDTTKAYQEIQLDRFAPTKQTWKAPYKSDWALAVGRSIN